jgi:hypothetical protein
MRNISDEICGENKKNAMYVEQRFSANRAVYGIIEKCTGGQFTDDNIILRIDFACWISTATNTHPECVQRIVFPRKQRFRERPSVLRYAHITCRVVIYLFFDSRFIIFLHSKERRRTSKC